MIDFTGYSERGTRDTNEDSYLTESGSGYFLAVLADGLGGHGGGQAASEAACAAIVNHLKRQPVLDKNNLNAAVSEAQNAVMRLHTQTLQMKTTIVMLFILNETAACVHVGDSRLYHFRNGIIDFQTTDHSVSQLAVFAGEITKDDIRNHPDRGKLLRALGSDNGVQADISFFTAEKGDAFLLCSDGFWEPVTENKMESCLLASESSKQWLDKMRFNIEPDDNSSALAVILR